MKPVPTDATFSNFRSSRMQLAWLSHSRPDLIFEVSNLDEVVEARFLNNKSALVKRVIKILKFARDNPVRLLFKLLDHPSIHIIGFYDASFANNQDLSKQYGYILFLRDRFDHYILLQFKSYKARRIARSVLSG